jgi:hypothetical protein
MIFGCQAGAAPRKVLLFSGQMIDAPGRREACRSFPCTRLKPGDSVARAATPYTHVDARV